MTSLVTALLAPLAAEAEKGAGAAPYVVGGTILAILLACVLLMLVFGKGREHS